MAVQAFSPASAHSTRRRISLASVVNGVLFLVVLAGPFVFIEPSPYEAAFALLALAFLIAREPVDPAVVPLALLLLVWNVSGLAALVPFMHDQKAVTFMATSIYLAVTAVMFACLFAEDIERRLALTRAAYVLAALVAAVIGIAAYFHLLPDSDRFLLGSIRAKSTFKDPNVYGPFLILPLLFLGERALRQGARPLDLVIAPVLLLGLFLSFSRGAWAHFVASAALLTLLMFLTSPNPRFRARIIALGLLAIVSLTLLLAVLLSFDAIETVFEERANLIQEYDAGPGGRFGRQMEGVLGIIEHPFGIGPLQFAKAFGHDPHNVYLNAFASYGWAGGVAYLIMVLTTLYVGFRAALVRTRWQPYLLAAYAAFAGAVLEGVVIDTDHWRHFYLLLGMIWGLAIATRRATAPHRIRPEAPQPATAPPRFPVFRLG
jgi:O-antigen ligase